ncbi:MAG: hypothetical protein HP496_14615 [Nitrospira sp.]|nr:hypothetical protein [Nitrospira sp.]
MVALTATSIWAEPLSIQDREVITRLGSAQGHSENEITPLLDHVSKAGEKGIPTESLLNKMREGLAKGVEPKRIDPVLRQMTSRLESAHEVLEEAKGRPRRRRGESAARDGNAGGSVCTGSDSR